MEEQSKNPSSAASKNISDLPEDCLAEILSQTGPIQSCKLATVSPSFSSASKSSAVWDKFLPPDCHVILSRSDDDRASLPKKHLFLSLCRSPVLIDGGRKSFSLDKVTGKKIFMISARGLRIEWSDSSLYWRWISHPDSRFAEAAELMDVCWFEITGKIETQMLSPSTKYAAYLVFKYSPGKTAARLGFHRQDLTATVAGREGEVESSRTVCLEIGTGDWRRQFGMYNDDAVEEMMDYEFPKQRKDGWLEAELGEFYVGEDGDDMVEVEIGLKEVISGPKSGLVVLGMEIRPKG
ncbi:Putative F-box protein PP2-B12 [Linum grandiflorum]